MSEPAEKFASAAERLFVEQVADFAKWMDENWQAEVDEDFTEAQANGWNRCAASIMVAFEAWTVASRPQRSY